MKKIEAEFTIVTPMFIGAANQEAHDVRPPSLKGALRFWWRALNWGRMLADANGDTATALCALHKQEAHLFGLAAGDNSGGQGVFLLTLKQAVKAEESLQGVNQYLMGQGLKERNALVSGTFTASLLFRPGTNEEDQRSVAEALFAFGLLGGLGSRARHGMGSVSLTGWQGGEFSVPQTAADYGKAIKGLLTSLPGTLPPFTAFSRKSRIDISAENHDSLKLLTTVGSEMQLYRSFGQNGKVANKPAERNFTPDHDLMQQATDGRPIDRAPVRAVFGLPHNYFFSSTKGKADINYKVPNSKGELVDARRASPLLLHIHRFPDGKCLAVHTLLPATFLPEGARIRVKSKTNSQVSFTPDWQVLHAFLNRFETKETLHG